MKIIVSQQNLPAQAGKKLSVEFYKGKIVDKYYIGKADEFLVAIDKFIRKRKLNIDFLKKAELEFFGTGILTERVIRAIILGLSF